MSMPSPAAGHTAVVTGASSGIGLAIARELAHRGHSVTLVARSADKLEKLATDLRSTGAAAHVLVTDLSDRAARASLPDRIAGLDLTPDILVNNAGFSTLGPVAGSDVAAELALIEVDVMAVVDLCSRFVPGMVERRRGAVLNVASTGAFQPLPGQASYGAAKAFVLSYTESLSAELRGTGVSASVLCPGPVDTGFGERAGFTKEDAESALPAFMWEPVEVVAKTGIAALEKGRVVAVPGVANRAAAFGVRFLPRQFLASLIARGHPGLRR